ncbi:MAG: YfhO family protein [Salinivirgaceae bacterium]|nr:YfhO family protein [Salinivirgaceae bacterium]
MTKKFDYSALKPHLFALLLFAVISFGYFRPVLEGKMLRQGDMMAYAGMVQELKELEAETGEYALWTDRMFGGMPTFLMNNPGHANLVRHLHSALNLNHPRPANHIFLYMLGFYIALLLFGVNPWVSMVGALAYAFSTYFIIIIDAGHITKVMALGYLPLVVASVHHAFQTDRFRGSVLLGLFLSMQIYVNHLQITYYTFIIVAFLGLFEIIRATQKKKLPDFGKTMAYLAVAALLAMASNLTTLWTVVEYGDYSMRGKPNIVDPNEPKSSGLPIDYITGWSYGKVESLNLLIPNLKGGSSHMSLGNKSATYKELERNYGKANAEKYGAYLNTYWGEQPFTSGPVYIGASVILLFLLGMFLLKGNLRWWLLTATFLALLLAWGRNFMWFTEFFVNYVPGYNKFRTVSMILIIVQFTMPLLGIIAFDQILKNKFTFAQIKRPLIYSLSIVVGLILVALVIVPASAIMVGSDDSQLPEVIQKALQVDRLSMLRSDAFRSLLFVLVTSGLIWAIAQHKIKKTLAIVSLGLLLAFDLIPVTLRYSQNDNWVSRRELKNNPYKPTQADLNILKDTEHYRVLNLAVNTFNDASTSYFHNSIGGYHGAKMQRYQELITHQIQPEMRRMIDVLQESVSYARIDSLLQQLPVLNMLNTRYFILSPQDAPLKNAHSYGQAWFVDDVAFANGAIQEMQMLSNYDLKTTAIIDKEFEAKINPSAMNSNTKSIKMESYSANRLKYSYKSETDAMAVFSEIYYPKGWIATVNGKELDIIRVNYLLRGLVVPAGENTIEFEFQPNSYFIGNVVSYMASSILILLGILAIYLGFKGKKEV